MDESDRETNRQIDRPTTTSFKKLLFCRCFSTRCAYCRGWRVSVFIRASVGVQRSKRVYRQVGAVQQRTRLSR